VRAEGLDLSADQDCSLAACPFMDYTLELTWGRRARTAAPPGRAGSSRHRPRAAQTAPSRRPQRRARGSRIGSMRMRHGRGGSEGRRIDSLQEAQGPIRAPLCQHPPAGPTHCPPHRPPAVHPPLCQRSPAGPALRATWEPCRCLHAGSACCPGCTCLQEARRQGDKRKGKGTGGKRGGKISHPNPHTLTPSPSRLTVLSPAEHHIDSIPHLHETYGTERKTGTREERGGAGTGMHV
jgi:hypothetical protein